MGRAGKSRFRGAGSLGSLRVRYRQAYGIHSLRSRAGLQRGAELFERAGQGCVAVEGFQARFFGESFDSLMNLTRNVSEARFEDFQDIFPQGLEAAFLSAFFAAFLPAFLYQLFSQCHDILLEFTDIRQSASRIALAHEVPC